MATCPPRSRCRPNASAARSRRTAPKRRIEKTPRRAVRSSRAPAAPRSAHIGDRTMKDIDTLKDTIACTAVLASILLTMACGAFVVDTPPDTSNRYAQASLDTQDD